jgi:hypothetical protein
MSVRVVFRPLERWDRKIDAARPHSPFRAPYQDTIDLLEREVQMLGARQVVVELAINESDLRLDGQPYANTRPRHPGVTIAFNSHHGPLKYTADKFATWTENIRAIALGLEALRKVDRYGVTSRGEQYAGWKALSAGGPTPEQGIALIREHGSLKAALFATHPDHGGDAEQFAAVQAAREAGLAEPVVTTVPTT